MAPPFKKNRFHCFMTTSIEIKMLKNRWQKKSFHRCRSHGKGSALSFSIGLIPWWSSLKKKLYSCLSWWIHLNTFLCKSSFLFKATLVLQADYYSILTIWMRLWKCFNEKSENILYFYIHVLKEWPLKFINHYRFQVYVYTRKR